MSLPELDINHELLKRWLKLFCLRLAVILAHLIAIADGFSSFGRYPILKTCLKGGPCPGDNTGGPSNTTKPQTESPKKPVTKPGTIGICSMSAQHEDVDSHMFNFNMAFFILLAFYTCALINFGVTCVVNFRLVLFPIKQEADYLGRPLPTRWHKIKDATFNFGTFPCDTIILSCIIGVYASKRTKGGLACWECYADPKCTSEDDYNSILFMSSLAMNLNMFLVLLIVFYKGFINWFYTTDPEKCDCHCVIPRCITGCFVSLITTSVIMMPPFVVLSDKHYGLPGVEGNLFSTLMGNMKMIGIIIWVVIGAFLFIVIPVKWLMFRRKT